MLAKPTQATRAVRMTNQRANLPVSEDDVSARRARCGNTARRDL